METTVHSNGDGPQATIGDAPDLEPNPRQPTPESIPEPIDEPETPAEDTLNVSTPVARGTDANRPHDSRFHPTVQRLIWVDRLALQLRDCSDRLTVPLAFAARGFNESRAWIVFGCARAEDHCREHFDRTARWLRDLAILGRGLDTLPGLERAVLGDDGGAPLGRSAAIGVARSATPESAAAWIRLGRSLSARDFRDARRQAWQAKSAWPVEPLSSPGRTADAVDESGSRDGPRCEVRVPVPPPLRVAFDEVLQLHRAVSGRDVPAADFIEALVAEALTGPVPVDVDRVPLKPARSVERAERELANVTRDWDWLNRLEPEVPLDRNLYRNRDFDRLCRDTDALLRDLELATVEAVGGSPADLDRRIRRLLRLEDRIERQLGRLLKYMGDKHAWLRLEFDGVEHYAAERLAMNRRTARDRARAATVTKRLPLLRRAYESGELGLQATLLVARALGAQLVPHALERAWVDQARKVSIKRLRDEVRVAEREWMEHGSWGPREPLSDEEWLRSLALFPGTTRRRFERLVGVAGSERWRDTMTHLTLRLSEAMANDFLAAIEDRRVHLQNAWITSSVAELDLGVGAPFVERIAAAFGSRGLALPAWVGLMALLEEYLLTWDPVGARNRSRWGAIYSRDGYRCSAPLCTSRRNLEAHHLDFRSLGGSDDASNLATACRHHHQNIPHGNLGQCHGESPLGVFWRIGREDVAVWYRNERKLG